MALHTIFRARPRKESPSTSITQSAALEASPITGDQASAVPQRTWRNVIGYYNALSGDIESPSCSEEPPTYEKAILNPYAGINEASRDLLPPYSCSVSAEDKLGLRYEYKDPFVQVDTPSWQDVYVILQGTQLSLYQVRSQGLFCKPGNAVGRAGRLLRQFTLQHAEVGLASDIKKIEWVPRSNLTRALSAAALEQLRQTEPHLFKAVRQYPLRLRLETEQFLLKFPTHDCREEWLHKICSAIDIAPPLDDRTEPNIHTLPRRPRNRHANPCDLGASVDLTSRPLVEEQDRLLRQYFPRLREQLAEGYEQNRPSSGSIDDELESQEAATNSSDPEREEIDQGFSVTLIATQDSLRASLDCLLPASQSAVICPGPRPSVHDLWASVHRPHPLTVMSTLPGKWLPGLIIDPTQERLYRRRCLPVLLKNSRRAVPFLVKDSIRYQIDFDTEELRQFPEPPPLYSKHSIRPRSEFARHSAIMTKSSDPRHVNIEEGSDDVYSTHMPSSPSTSSEDPSSSSDTRNPSWTQRLRRRHKQHNYDIPSASVNDYTLSYIKSWWTDGGDLRRPAKPENLTAAR